MWRRCCSPRRSPWSAACTPNPRSSPTPHLNPNPDPDPNPNPNPDPNPDQVASICTPEGAAGGKAATGGGQPKKSSFASVGAAFTRSLGALMQTLHACEGSHFVRCVKPNPELLPRKMHGESVTNQLRMSGMLDAVSLIQAGCLLCVMHLLYFLYSLHSL